MMSGERRRFRFIRHREYRYSGKLTARTYRRKPQKLQNTCFYMRIIRAVDEQNVSLCERRFFGPFLSVVFAVLGKPQKPKTAITASYTILHVFLFATIIHGAEPSLNESGGGWWWWPRQRPG